MSEETQGIWRDIPSHVKDGGGWGWQSQCPSASYLHIHSLCFITPWWLISLTPESWGEENYLDDKVVAFLCRSLVLATTRSLSYSGAGALTPLCGSCIRVEGNKDIARVTSVKTQCAYRIVPMPSNSRCPTPTWPSLEIHLSTKGRVLFSVTI